MNWALTWWRFHPLLTSQCRRTHNLWSFIGKENYLRKFIAHFSHGMHLLKAQDHDQILFMLEICARKHIKRGSSCSCLTNFEQAFNIGVYGYRHALGAVSMQHWRLVTYHSKYFWGAILYYLMYDSEMYALVQVVKCLWHFFLGKYIVVHCDHKGLQFFQIGKQDRECTLHEVDHLFATIKHFDKAMKRKRK